MDTQPHHAKEPRAEDGFRDERAQCNAFKRGHHKFNKKLFTQILPITANEKQKVGRILLPTWYFGGPTRIRTENQRIMSPLLHH